MALGVAGVALGVAGVAIRAGFTYSSLGSILYMVSLADVLLK